MPSSKKNRKEHKKKHGELAEETTRQPSYRRPGWFTRHAAN